ncbi:MAG: hypothetical protein NW217_02305 [Hyphomicrobiaceae bacterium]|nr:hypothetical protein [Hyphomicrobiaceae bacterium]
MDGNDATGFAELAPLVSASQDWLASAAQVVGQWLAVNWPVLSLMLAVYVGIVATRSFWIKVGRALQDTLFTNWQLAVLGATGLVLSVASGWTTWDGMRNFTGEPVLSLMITFGIQGVMLIVAWLIGESFATGMHRRGGAQARGFGGLWLPVTGAIVALAIMTGLTYLLIARDQLPFTSEQLLFAGVALAIIAFVGFLQGDLLQPYLQSGRIIVRNAVLWVMFLACMATSVFFSFDSLFSAIFPQDERARAAEIRAINQVAGVVADIGGLAETRRLESSEGLFKTQVWRDYEHQLDLAAGLARKAPAEIRAQLQAELEQQKERVAQLEESRANAEAQQAGLQVRKQQLNEELSRLAGERPQAASSTIEQQQVIADITRRLDEQRAKLLAEEKGVEGTGKVGRGQFWRAEKAAEERIRSELQVAEERLRAPKARVAEIDRRLASIRAELAQTDGDLAKLKGEAETAQQMIAVAQGGTPSETAERFDPSVGVAALDRDRQSFRQEPKQATLAAIQSQCGALVSASLRVESLRAEAAAIDCNPRAAIEAAGVVFALNDGLAAFRQNCAGGDRLPVTGGTDGLLQFGRKCLQDSGLASTDSAKMGAALSAIDLNRDDRAHRFVVTWNAFQDGNRLAYLALAIAIAIDSLVFMSGLFGANAVRSPLQDVPGDRPRSAKQLEDVIENALLPNTYENAHAVIEAMQPITPTGGFTQEVILATFETPGRAAVRKVLNAGATIGAVAQDPVHPARFLVRPELFEFLSMVAKKHYEQNSDNRRLSELKQLVTVALQPHVGDHAAIVLQTLDPIREVNGFSSQIYLSDVPPLEQPIVKRVLNAAATLSYVTDDKDRNEIGRFYVHKDLYKTLAMLAAANPRTYGWEADAHKAFARTALPSPQKARPDHGGRLREAAPMPLPQQHEHQRLTHRPAGMEPPVAPSAQGNDAARPAGSGQGAGPARPVPRADAHATGDFFEGRLLTALGFPDPDEVKARLSAPGVARAAMGAWRALKEHKDRNPRLNVLIERYIGEKDREMSEEYSELVSSLAGHSESRDLLDGVERAVSEALPVLMLFPEIGLVSYLISELEAAVSNDAVPMAAEITLLDRLRGVSDLLHGLDLSEPQSWAEVSALLNAPDVDHDEDEAQDGEGESGTGDGNRSDLPNVARWPRQSDGGSLS